MGAKKRPFYRIVAADSRRSRDGRFLEIVGTYDPIKKPAEVNIFEDKLTGWLDRGAIPSDTVHSLLSQIGFNEKYHLTRKGKDASGVDVKSTISERPKRTRKVKKAAVAAEEAEKAKAEAESKAEEEKSAEAPAEEKPAEEAPAEEKSE
jgi:small subunit ribosomal protein S16